jgi:hypothetical protein
MLSQEIVTEALVAKVYAALNAASAVAVLGWKPSWHNEWTLMAENLRHAIFIDEVGKKVALGPSVGYVVFTRRIDHTVLHHLKRRGVPMSPICFRSHQIHDLFRIWCTQMEWPAGVRRRA